MPGRSYNLNSYRLNYQGQESTPGTNWQAFELRLHNSDLGRWFAPDPKGQYNSPYISMGNNPVSGIDPDGGYVFVPRDLSPSGVRNFWMWRNMMGQYQSQRFMYEGEYRSGCEIENMRMRDYIEWRSDHSAEYDIIMGCSEYAPAFTGISHSNWANRSGVSWDQREQQRIQEKLNVIGKFEDIDGTTYEQSSNPKKNGYWRRGAGGKQEASLGTNLGTVEIVEEWVEITNALSAILDDEYYNINNKPLSGFNALRVDNRTWTNFTSPPMGNNATEDAMTTPGISMMFATASYTGTTLPGRTFFLQLQPNGAEFEAQRLETVKFLKEYEDGDLSPNLYYFTFWERYGSEVRQSYGAIPRVSLPAGTNWF